MVRASPKIIFKVRTNPAGSSNAPINSRATKPPASSNASGKPSSRATWASPTRTAHSSLFVFANTFKNRTVKPSHPLRSSLPRRTRARQFPTRAAFVGRQKPQQQAEASTKRNGAGAKRSSLFAPKYGAKQLAPALAFLERACLFPGRLKVGLVSFGRWRSPSPRQNRPPFRF